MKSEINAVKSEVAPRPARPAARPTPRAPASAQAGADESRGGLRPDSYLQSLEKGLAVLHAFTAARPWLTMAEVADLTGQDRAAARRALLTLHQLGYLSQRGKHFGLTAKVLGFGYEYLAALPFWALAHPVLEALSDELNETISIGVLDGADVVFILRVPAKRLLTFDPSTGSRLPAHLHSLGHILLAQLPDNELQPVLKRVKYTRFTPRSVMTEQELQDYIARARNQGWASSSCLYDEIIGGISVALKDRQGTTLAALNVSYVVDSDAERRSVADILPRLQLAARRIQEAMPAAAAPRRPERTRTRAPDAP
ncbi:MAG: pcaR [Ramlibacter sp.]|jgi:IclR family pca regulon transcriptional regulator|nr:pcaR [Ramlibacter sp.]